MLNLNEILKENIIRPFSKNYLIHLYESLIDIFPDSRCFLEIGAFDASHSIRMRRKYPDSTIYAFEAGPTNYLMILYF